MKQEEVPCFEYGYHELTHSKIYEILELNKDPRLYIPLEGMAFILGFRYTDKIAEIEMLDMGQDLETYLV